MVLPADSRMSLLLTHLLWPYAEHRWTYRSSGETRCSVRDLCGGETNGAAVVVDVLSNILDVPGITLTAGAIVASGVGNYRHQRIFPYGEVWEKCPFWSSLYCLSKKRCATSAERLWLTLCTVSLQLNLKFSFSFPH